MDDLSHQFVTPGGRHKWQISRKLDLNTSWAESSAVKFDVSLSLFFSPKNRVKLRLTVKFVDLLLVIVYFNVKDSMLFGDCHAFRDAMYLKLKSMLRMLFHQSSTLYVLCVLVFLIHKKTNRRHSPFVGPSFGVFCWRFFCRFKKASSPGSPGTTETRRDGILLR